MELIAEIITLRAIALKLYGQFVSGDFFLFRRDHNATSYSTETDSNDTQRNALDSAEIITLRAIALKHYQAAVNRSSGTYAEIITLRAIALKPN